MRAFITGADGFLGRHLVDALTRQGSEVQRARGDVLDPNSLAGIANADVVFHLAAQASPSGAEADPIRALRVNVVGTLQVATAMSRRQRLVFASTAQVYSPSSEPHAEGSTLGPTSVYGHSKLAAEQTLLALATRGPALAILRLFNVYGTGQSEDYVIGRLLGAVRRGETPAMGPSAPIRDFIHVDDVIDGMLRAAKVSLASSMVLNLGTGVGHSIAEAADLVGVKPRFDEHIHATWHPKLVADISRARAMLGWEPGIGLQEGLRRALIPP